MNVKYNHLKVLSNLSAHLVATLYDRNHAIFRLQEAADILGGRARAARILHQLTHNGVVTRLKSGMFRLVPFELGFEREYLGNPYIVACELALARHRQAKKDMSYLSYGSAFDLHQMATQPQLVVYVSCSRMIHSRTILGTEFRFVRCKPKDFFGITQMWVDKNAQIYVSDLERTLLDGLKQPAYCGGLSEVAKGFFIKRQAIDPQKIIDYAVKLNVGAVNRRLGYLMELYNIGSRVHLEFLHTTLTKTYQLLDPELPATGRYIARWRLRLNVAPEELLQVVET